MQINLRNVLPKYSRLLVRHAVYSVISYVLSFENLQYHVIFSVAGKMIVE
jgi:hypothetical protein